MVGYDLGLGHEGLRMLTRHKKPITPQQRKYDELQASEHKRATAIYVKHDPSYHCMCSYCRV